MNPGLRVPTLVLDDGRPLGESDAILMYLGEGTPYVPEDRYLRAQVLQWLFFEQYSHEPYIAVVRFWLALAASRPPDDEVEARREGGRVALAAMERHLATRTFLVGEAYSVADIALYAYTHVADEGGFDRAPYPAARAWLDASHPSRGTSRSRTQGQTDVARPSSDGEPGGADLARRARRAGGDPVAAGTVRDPPLDAERAARRPGRRLRADGRGAVAADDDAPRHAVAVLVDLELGLEAPVVGLGLQLGAGALGAAAGDPRLTRVPAARRRCRRRSRPWRALHRAVRCR